LSTLELPESVSSRICYRPCYTSSAVPTTWDIRNAPDRTRVAIRKGAAREERCLERILLLAKVVERARTEPAEFS
jgi:hypothetical protein